MSNLQKYKFERVYGESLSLVENAFDSLVSILSCNSSFISLDGIGIDMRNCQNESIINCRLTDKKYNNRDKNSSISDIKIINKKSNSLYHNGTSLGKVWLEAFCLYLNRECAKEENNQIYLEWQKLIKLLKYNQNIDNHMLEMCRLNYESVTKLKKELEELLEEIPVAKNVSVEDFKIIEDKCSDFINDLNLENLNIMKEIFKKYNIDISEIVKKLENKLLAMGGIVNFNNSYEYNDVEDKVSLYTDFYTHLTQSKSLRYILKNSPEYTIFIIAALGYFKSILGSTNPLIFTESNEMSEIWKSYSELDAQVYYSDIKAFFELVKSKLDLEIDNIEDKKNIEDILDEDKGKFKLTLFKTLAKENKLNPDMTKTDKDDANTCYFISFNNSYLHHIRVAIYYNPAEDNHCINVYMGENGDTKLGYWWNKELNYEDLIKYLCKLVCDAEKKEYEKFKLTEFKQTCNKIGLDMDMSETPILVEKYYKINTVTNGKQYITRFIVPIYFRNTKDADKKILIRTIREEIYYTWNGPLDYNNLYLKIAEIYQEGIKVLDEERNMMLKNIDKKYMLREIDRNDMLREIDKKDMLIEIDKNAMLNKIDKNAMLREIDKKDMLIEIDKKNMLKEIDKNAILNSTENKLDMEKAKKEAKLIKDSEMITSSKDVRAILSSYITENHKEINLPLDFNMLNMLLSNKLNDLGYLLNIGLGSVSSTNGMGKSKVWTLSNKNTFLIINEKAEIKKQIEGLLEGFVFRFTLGSGNIKAKRVREGLTFMLCKSFNLDVRTYCEGSDFDSLYKGDKKTKVAFIKATIDFYNNISKLFR